MNLNEKRLSGETRYAGKILTLEIDRVELPDGRHSTREVVRHPGGACVAALTERDELLFVRQFRYPYGRVLWELPAGKLSPGEDPAVCAARELSEETGATAAEWHALGLFCPVGAYSTERIQMYLARGLTFGERELDEDEFLNVFRMPLDELVDKVLAGEIPDAKTQAAALRAKLMLERGLI